MSQVLCKLNTYKSLKTYTQNPKDILNILKLSRPFTHKKV